MTRLDEYNPLTDLFPEEARKYVYAVLGLAVLVYGAYNAADGDWLEALGSLLGSLGFGLGASNANPRRRGLRDN